MLKIIRTSNRSLIDDKTYYQVGSEINNGIAYICKDIMNAKMQSAGINEMVWQLRTPVWREMFTLTDWIKDIQFYLPHEK